MGLMDPLRVGHGVQANKFRAKLDSEMKDKMANAEGTIKAAPTFSHEELVGSLNHPNGESSPCSNHYYIIWISLTYTVYIYI